MDLFHVERFSGEGVYDEHTTIDKDAEQRRLDILNKRIKERRLLQGKKKANNSCEPLIIASGTGTAEQHIASEDRRKDKKKQKKKHSEGPEPTENDIHVRETASIIGLSQEYRKQANEGVESCNTSQSTVMKKHRPKHSYSEMTDISEPEKTGEVEKEDELLAKEKDKKLKKKEKSRRKTALEEERPIVDNLMNGTLNGLRDSSAHTTDRLVGIKDCIKNDSKKDKSNEFSEEINIPESRDLNDMERNENISLNSDKPNDFVDDVRNTDGMDVKGDSNDVKEQGKGTSIHGDTNKSHNSEEVYFKILGNDNRRKRIQNVKRAVPMWLREPILVSGNIQGDTIPLDDIDYLSEDLIKKLKSNNMTHLFPIQSSVIPYILSQTMTGSIYCLGGMPPRDICVSAPTGSGKTLAYVLPILQILSVCKFRRLQALVIVPTKELASQIKNVFQHFTQNTSLRVGLASGQNTFKSEQDALVCKSLGRYYSNIDILVSTPGRLVDHLLQTTGFSLKELRFLVIDEADRLLSLQFSNWCDRIIEEVYGKDDTNSRFKDIVPCAASFVSSKLPFQKLLFSATLTHDPEKLAPLRLHRPVMFASRASSKVDINDSEASGRMLRKGNEGKAVRYVVPSGLDQRMHICGDSLKPLLVLYLMTELKYKGVLCFTNSKEVTHRLFLLAKEYGGIRAAEFSAALNHAQRKGVIRDFIAGKIDLLISTDAMARGIDIDNVKVVVSYDPPVNIKTYIHRVGRTARAGNQGMAITLLLRKEAYHFKQILQKLGHYTLPRLNIKATDIKVLADKYEEALKSLSVVVDEEKHRGKNRKRKFVSCLDPDGLEAKERRTSDSNVQS